jgi:Pretoxin HINT domain
LIQTNECPNGIEAINQFKNGNILGGILGMAGAFGMASQLRACFTGETPLRMADGSSKRIDEIAVGDVVLSRSEFEPGGNLESRPVLQTFVRVSPILNMHVGGKVIGTTAEHPFYVLDFGWKPAAQLTTGDRLKGLGDEILIVEGIADSGRVETVYNLEVAEDHTYFVELTGTTGAVWAHNTTYKQNGKLTEPTLPPSLIVQKNGVKIEHYFRGNDHPPPHFHVYGSGPNTKIGTNGKPIAGYPELSSRQLDVINENISKIRSAGNKIRDWLWFLRQPS